MRSSAGSAAASATAGRWKSLDVDIPTELDAVLAAINPCSRTFISRATPIQPFRQPAPPPTSTGLPPMGPKAADVTPAAAITTSLPEELVVVTRNGTVLVYDLALANAGRVATLPPPPQCTYDEGATERRVTAALLFPAGAFGEPLGPVAAGLPGAAISSPSAMFPVMGVTGDAHGNVDFFTTQGYCCSVSLASVMAGAPNASTPAVAIRAMVLTECSPIPLPGAAAVAAALQLRRPSALRRTSSYSPTGVSPINDAGASVVSGGSSALPSRAGSDANLREPTHAASRRGASQPLPTSGVAVELGILLDGGSVVLMRASASPP